MAKKKSRPAAHAPEIPAFLQATDKRTAVLRAAMLLFLRDGYSNTSMDAVTEEAGVSKATVYAHFASKSVLFETLMREGAAAAFSQFPQLEHQGGDPEKELYDFLEVVLTHILMRGGYAWDRLVIAEAVRHPEYARLFQKCALDRLRETLERYLRSLATKHTGPVASSGAAAEALLTLTLIGPIHDALLLGPRSAIDGERLRFGLRLFLRGMNQD